MVAASPGESDRGAADAHRGQLLCYYAASWFAQQAVEKGLKALYMDLRGALAPRTHDLQYLGRQVHVATSVAAELALLNPAFDLVRYPDPVSGRAPVDTVTSTLAAQHIAAAERVIAWLDTQLKPPSLRN